uniref:Uncharacterized protein n=1 Tax=Opuntia streptacantha TaxID=393608 RepID=A0A7C9D512_OPUST
MWAFQSELMHDPTRFDPIWGPISIKHQSLPHPYYLPGLRVVYDPILTRGFPVSRCRRSVGPKTCGILAITKAEEVPFTAVELSHLGEFPWLTSMQINLNQSAFKCFLISNLFVKVMTNQFFITWVESESWR